MNIKKIVLALMLVAGAGSVVARQTEAERTRALRQWPRHQQGAYDPNWNLNHIAGAMKKYHDRMKAQEAAEDHADLVHESSAMHDYNAAQQAKIDQAMRQAAERRAQRAAQEHARQYQAAVAAANAQQGLYDQQAAQYAEQLAAQQAAQELYKNAATAQFEGSMAAAGMQQGFDVYAQNMAAQQAAIASANVHQSIYDQKAAQQAAELAAQEQARQYQAAIAAANAQQGMYDQQAAQQAVYRAEQAAIAAANVQQSIYDQKAAQQAAELAAQEQARIALAQQNHAELMAANDGLRHDNDAYNNMVQQAETDAQLRADNADLMAAHNEQEAAIQAARAAYFAKKQAAATNAGLVSRAWEGTKNYAAQAAAYARLNPGKAVLYGLGFGLVAYGAKKLYNWYYAPVRPTTHHVNISATVRPIASRPTTQPGPQPGPGLTPPSSTPRPTTRPRPTTKPRPATRVRTQPRRTRTSVRPKPPVRPTRRTRPVIRPIVRQPRTLHVKKTRRYTKLEVNGFVSKLRAIMFNIKRNHHHQRYYDAQAGRYTDTIHGVVWTDLDVTRFINGSMEPSVQLYRYAMQFRLHGA